MATANTSLSFSTSNQSLWSPGPATTFRVDTGDYLIYDPGEVSKTFGFDAKIFDVSFTAYLDVRFGLVAWANLGTAGSWDASYEFDVTVDLPGAVLGSQDPIGNPVPHYMSFDFSRYDIVSAEISSEGFGPGERGIGAGLDLIIDVEAGVRDITLETWIKDWNFGGFDLLDIDHEINLISVTLANPELTLDLFEGVELTARLPQGADTEGSSARSGVVEGHGSSDTRFIELSADLDELLTGLLGKLGPHAAAIGKTLANTVFAKFDYSLGDYISLVPDDAVRFSFTMVDIGASIGLVVTEDVELDITERGPSNLPDIRITLTSDNGTPDNPDDDVVGMGKLGDTISLRTPDATPYGTALVSAEFAIQRAHFSHDVGLGLNASITMEILTGKLQGSWVPSWLEVSFGPLYEVEFPEDGLNISLGTLFSNDFEVPGSIFNTEQDTYEVFYAQQSIVPASWRPEIAGAEQALYAYFEASYEQASATLAQFNTSGFNVFPNPAGATTPTILDYTNQAQKVFFLWIANQDILSVTVNPNNGSVVQVAPSPAEKSGDPPIQDNLFAKLGTGAYLYYSGAWEDKYAAAQDSADAASVGYHYHGKSLTTSGKTNVLGQDRGDVVIYYGGGDYYDGAGNENQEYDVFIADFSATDAATPIRWDLPKSIFLESDGDATTMGGVILADHVTVKNMEAAILITGSGDDYLVGGAKSDVFDTGPGDDIVKLVYYVPGTSGLGGGYDLDLSDDLVRLGAGNDTTLVELGNIPDPYGEFTDQVFGGKGVDSVYVTVGVQGLRYDANYWDGISIGYRFAGQGIGADALHADLTDLLGIYTEHLQTAYDIRDSYVLEDTHFLIMNGGPQQGRIEIAFDVEAVSIMIPDGSGRGGGDDLVVFMGGTHYDGGGGIDTFAADFSAWESARGLDGTLIGTRGGIQLKVDDAISYFGATVIQGMERLHVTGTSDADVIYGANARVVVTPGPDPKDPGYNAERDITWAGASDFINGSDGDDYLSGGIDALPDEMYGRNGNDTFFWTKFDDGANGTVTDQIYGGSGIDTLNISHDQVGDAASDGHTYRFYDQNGEVVLYISADSSSSSAWTSDMLLALEYIRDPDAYGVTQASSFNTATVKYTGIERVNISGNSHQGDLLIYQGGDFYRGGESSGDVFVADFRGQETGIDFRIKDASNQTSNADGYWLANEVFIEGIEGGVIWAGDGLDILIGGRGNDIFFGGGGDDIVYGGIDSGNDLLDGGAGDDTFFWGSHGSNNGGYDTISGGENPSDQPPDFDQLMISGGTGPTRIAIQEFDQIRGKWIDILPSYTDYGDRDLNVSLNNTNDAQARGYAWAYDFQQPANGEPTPYRTTVHGDRATLQLLAENSLRTDIRWEYFNGNVGRQPIYDLTTGTTEVGSWRDPTRQRDGTALTYEQMESVDIAGSDEHDDLIVFQNGVAYVGGERAGDADIFLADLRNFTASLTLNVNAGSGIGYDIGQGTRIADFERFHLLLGSGDDTVGGGDLDDTVYAGSGNDQLSGGLGDDLMFGEDGNDFFEHTGGNDQFDGGEGSDVLLLSADAAPYTLAFQDVSGAQIGASLTMVGGAPGFQDFAAVYGITNGEYIFVTHGASSLKFRGMEEVHVSGSEKNDVLIGGEQQGILYGGAGNDALIGRGGNDFMSGGSGSDIYVFGAGFGNDVIFGETTGSSKLMFTAHTQAQLAFSLDGVDLIINSGDDTVRVRDYFAEDDRYGLNFSFETSDGTFTRDFASLGAVSTGAVIAGVTFIGSAVTEDFDAVTARADTIRLFGGDDFVLGSAGADLFDGGAGSDSVSYLGSGKGVTVNLISFAGTGGFAKGDLLVSVENLAGSQFGDVITGNAFSNVIAGAAGNDELLGMNGNDVLTGDEGADTIGGGGGTDRVYGGEGNDQLSGGDGDDYLAGGVGADVLNGGAGADLLDDGAGNDTVAGGGSNDIFIYGDGTDSWDGGVGADTADFDRFGAAVRIDLTAQDEVVTRDGQTFDQASGALRVIAQLSGIENMRGTVFADRLEGNAGANQIEGNLGDDKLTGNEGEDTLVGGGGMDTVDYSLETGTGGVSVWLDTPGAEYGVDTHGDTDVISGVEIVIGTSRVDHITGNAADNIILGGAGDDYYLDGMAGNDIVYGEDGKDRIFGGDGADVLVGGAGSDDVNGEDGDDLFLGADGTGNDTYDGGDGVDTVSYAGDTLGIKVDLKPATGQVSGAGTGTDTLVNIENIVGGAGNDSMTGGSLDDMFSYSGGLDTFIGADGRDTVGFDLFGAAVLADLAAPDEARTRDRADLQSGSWRTIAQIGGVENIVGTAHNDELLGNALDNALAGGDGNDRLDGRGGNDTLIGGDGADVFVNQFANGGDTFDGGDGIDTLDYSASPSRVEANLFDGDGDDELIGIERLVGSTFGDELYGNDADNIIQGGEGDDSIHGGYGNDLIVYDAGDDEVSGGADSDTLDYTLFGSAIWLDLGSTAEVRTADAASWNTGVLHRITSIVELDVENAIGTDFNDRLTGDDGANMLNGGLGNDLLEGMGGDDMFSHTGGLDTWNGGEGDDTANYSSYRFAVLVGLTLAVTQAMTRGGADLDSGEWEDIGKLSNIENVVGSMFDDQLTGNAQANTLAGFAGNDSLYGDTGVDKLLGGEGDDLLVGGGGADTIDGGEGFDTVAYEASTVGVVIDLGAGTASGGPAAGDMLSGIEGVIGSTLADDITGSALDNALSGGAGADTLTGGAGNDTMTGGAGADALFGGSGLDTATYALAATGVTVDLATGTGTTGEASGDTLEAIEILIGSGFADRLSGSDASESFRGGNGNDLLSGAGGNDALAGDAGADQLSGGAGSDTLEGGAGNDQLTGGEGLDFLSGGAGDDVYLVDAGDTMLELAGQGKDTVRSATSFTLAANFETLTLTGSTAASGTGNTAANLLTGNAAANQLSGGTGNDTLQGAAGNDKLAGGGGNDVLKGGLGKDLLSGGAGADVFVFDSALSSDNRDTLTDFAPGGGDKLQLDDDVFRALTGGVALTAVQLHAAPGANAAHDASDRIVYNTNTGALYYDADGIGGSAAVQFALLGATTHPTLTTGSFQIVG